VTPFAGGNAGFELSGTGALPAGWSAVPAGATPAARVEIPDAHGGAAVLRFDGAACGAGCGATVSDPVPVRAGQSAVVRFWARSDVPEANPFSRSSS
jgi:hypothetical protein